MKTRQLFLAIIAVLGWFALSAQLYLIIANRVTSITEAIIRYFSFFTILTNIVVALCCTVLLLKPNSVRLILFSRQTTLAAVAVYITIVGIIYNLILRQIWNPQGLQRAVDESLHLVIPILFLLYWLIFEPKEELKWKDTFTWLSYPLIYIILILIRGALSGFYPYPFIDVNVLGYSKVFLNSCGITIAFMAVSLLFVAIARFTKIVS